MSDVFSDIYKEISLHPSNATFLDKGYSPLYTASAKSKIVMIGQAPGKKAQESGVPMAICHPVKNLLSFGTLKY